MKILFIGTPEFAIPCLKRIVEDAHEIVGVITRPDRPKGRSLKLQPSHVKERSLEMGLKILQPESLKKKEVVKSIRELAPEVIVCVAYGKIIPETILNLLPDRLINLHPSLLPLYRGAAPINWALVNGDSLTGATSMLMDTGMDTGKILLSREMPIDQKDDAAILSAKLALLSADVLSDTLIALEGGKLKPVAQNDSLATYAPMLKKEDGLIDWRKTSREIHNLRRGMFPWPGAIAFAPGKRVLLGRTQIGNPVSRAGELPGTLLALEEKSLVVECGGGTTLLIETLKPEGRNFMGGKEFFNGRYIKIGETFESTPVDRNIPEKQS